MNRVSATFLKNNILQKHSVKSSYEAILFPLLNVGRFIAVLHLHLWETLHFKLFSILPYNLSFGNIQKETVGEFNARVCVPVINIWRGRRLKMQINHKN